ncbi:hypothetical protein CLPU_1c02390 [Gottschalkia purinilytica]|uniref:Lipoprotein n=1 Tax=Gottschalkia purinilytica TaxID=1503 RepID=A0A0L0WF26_GOTPU|nr:DUF5052 family protein [Gottschalkia purinilytica]KNF10074.1 hypothetical protein CLPU_1c02390 [Gottschalkia purinilytica]
MKIKKILLAAILGISLISLSACTEDTKRSVKDFKSNWTGGLERTVQVYSNDGKLIKEYKGKIDIENKDDGTTKFDIDGKRVIIKNAIVIIEES